MKLCWLLTTFQSDAAAAAVAACRFQSVFPSSAVLVCFPCSQGWKCIVRTVMSCCSDTCCQTFCQAAGDFDFPEYDARARALSSWDARLGISLHTRRGIPKKPDLYEAQDTNSHPGMRLWETAKDLKHHQWAVVSNIWTYISQGKIETPIRRGGQFWCRFVANLLQYLCQKSSTYNAVWQSHSNKNLAIANRSRVSSAHNTLTASVVTS